MSVANYKSSRKVKTDQFVDQLDELEGSLPTPSRSQLKCNVIVLPWYTPSSLMSVEHSNLPPIDQDGLQDRSIMMDSPTRCTHLLYQTVELENLCQFYHTLPRIDRA